MKKIILTVALIASGMVASAQVGIGTEDPKSTLDIIGNAGLIAGVLDAADGVSVPRVTTDMTIAQGDTNAPVNGVNDGQLVYSTTNKGFFYWEKSGATTGVWKAVGGSSKNVYTDNGTLTGARTVTQDNNNLTFVTGSARAIVNGSFQTTGAVYAKIRKHETSSNIEWAADDYGVIVTSGSISGNLALPNASDNTNRILMINNASTNAVSFISTLGENRPITTASLAGGRTGIFISDGSNWYALGK